MREKILFSIKQRRTVKKFALKLTGNLTQKHYVFKKYFDHKNFGLSYYTSGEKKMYTYILFNLRQCF
jgi:hypothetical protein